EIEDRCPPRHARRSLLGARITEIRLLTGRDHGFATRTACRHGRLSLKKRPRKPFAVIRLEHFEPVAAGGGKMSIGTHGSQRKPRTRTSQPSNPQAGCRIVAKDAQQFRRSDGRCWENACFPAGYSAVGRLVPGLASLPVACLCYKHESAPVGRVYACKAAIAVSRHTFIIRDSEPARQERPPENRPCRTSPPNRLQRPKTSRNRIPRLTNRRRSPSPMRWAPRNG